MALYMKVLVEQHERGLLYVNGRFVRLLEPGLHRFVRPFARVRVAKTDLRVRTIQILGQELMTADRVSLRLNLAARYRIRDPEVAAHAVEDAAAQLYTDLQLALREAVGSTPLDEMLSSRGAVGRAVEAAVRPKAEAYGLHLHDAGLKDVVLPGDMKEILNQVIAARKRAEAAQIERREEVAATRSLANTAALLEKNPTLMRLKEMELLEKVLANGAARLVVGLPPDVLRLVDLKEP